MSTYAMKKIRLVAFSAFCFTLNFLSAQITITNSVFPAVGDTLRYATDNNPPAGLNPATPPGGAQTWDFSGLTADANNLVVFRSPNNGQNAGSFTGAEAVVITNTRETYYNITNAQFQVLGYSGDDPTNLGIKVLAPFSPALVERRAPANFFDISASNSNLSLIFPTDVPPLDNIFNNLSVNIDSMRLNINTNRTDVIDAYGNCVIPGASYPVLRQKRTEYRSTGIEVYVLLFPGFGNWVDLASLGGSGISLGNLIGTDTIVSYRFLSATEKEEIAVAYMNNDLNQVISVQFKQENVVSDFEPAIGDAAVSASMQVFPNPAVSWVRFDCANLPNDVYTLKLFNATGQMVWKQDDQISGNRSIQLELDSFKKGVYLYNLVDSKGKPVRTKHQVILKL